MLIISVKTMVPLFMSPERVQWLSFMSLRTCWAGAKAEALAIKRDTTVDRIMVSTTKLLLNRNDEDFLHQRYIDVSSST